MVFDTIYQTIRKANPETADEVLIIGIGGNTGSGKTSFALEFSEFLKNKDICSICWGNDLYQAPRSEKNKKRSELILEGADRKDDWWKMVGEEIYYNTYNRDLLEEHLKRFKSRQDINPINLYNGETGEWDKEMSHSFNGYQGPFWLLHDGVYLFHERVRSWLDNIVLLVTGEEKLVSDQKLGEISEERKVRFQRVYERGLKRGYKVDFYLLIYIQQSILEIMSTLKQILLWIILISEIEKSYLYLINISNSFFYYLLYFFILKSNFF